MDTEVLTQQATLTIAKALLETSSLEEALGRSLEVIVDILNSEAGAIGPEPG